MYCMYKKIVYTLLKIMTHQFKLLNYNAGLIVNPGV